MIVGLYGWHNEYTLFSCFLFSLCISLHIFQHINLWSYLVFLPYSHVSKSTPSTAVHSYVINVLIFYWECYMFEQMSYGNVCSWSWYWTIGTRFSAQHKGNLSNNWSCEVFDTAGVLDCDTWHALEQRIFPLHFSKLARIWWVHALLFAHAFVTYYSKQCASNTWGVCKYTGIDLFKYGLIIMKECREMRTPKLHVPRFSS